MRLSLCAALVLTACSAGPASRPAAPRTADETMERARSIMNSRSSDFAKSDGAAPMGSPPPTVELRPFPSKPRVAPPPGVRCAVFGTGQGIPRQCGTGLAQVHASKTSDAVEAVVEARGAEFAWGLFAGRSRLWMHVEDATFRVDGFVDPGDVSFLLQRETPIVKDHVWLKAGIGVHPLGADAGGIAVEVDRDPDEPFPGFENIPAHVPCDAILYEAINPTGAAAPDFAPVAAAAPIDDARTEVYPAKSSLTLYTTPGAKPLATLGDEKAPFSPSLFVLDKKSGWTRVGFETAYARFDVWAKDGDVVEKQEWGDAFGSSSCCGGLGLRGVSSPPRKINADTPVTVGKAPGAAATGAVTILRGVDVDVVERVDGWVAVEPRGRSIVSAPPDTQFWVPADRVD